MTIKALITSLTDLIVPAGTVVAGVRFILTPNAGGASITEDVAGPLSIDLANVTTANFAVTDPGDYTITAQALDAAIPANLLGTAVSTVVTITGATTITVSVPSALSASVV